MKHRFQCSLHALGVLVFGFGCASGDATELSPGAPAADGQGTTVAAEEGELASEEDDGAEQVDIEALLRENQEQIEQIDAQWRGLYTPEEASKLLADLGLRTWTYDELVAESTRKQTQVLLPEERELLSRHFAELSPEEEVGFTGRVIMVGDMMVDADALLEALAGPERVVEKGFGCLQSTMGTVGCEGLTGTYLRNDGDGNADTVDFFRPDVGRATFMIIADNAPDFLFNVLVEATSRIENLNPPGDCLGANAFVPIRQRDYNPLDAITKASTFTLTVTYGFDPCPNGGKACASLPKGKNVLILPPGQNSGGVSQGRMAFGDTLLVNSRFFNLGGQEDLRATIFHELMHSMGMSHNVVDAALHKIPGTFSSPGVLSVMTLPSTEQPNALSGDDVHVIKTLYSDNPNRSNDSCGYFSGFRNFGAIAINGCPPNSIPSGDQAVCCGPACDTCGGSGCSGRPGGTDSCCTGRILSNAVSCTGLVTGPCVVP